MDTESPRDRVIISLRGVDVTLNGRKLLSNIHWELRAGEHWGVVGENGSGKTSLLKLIGGALSPAVDDGARRYDFGFGVQVDAVQAHEHIAWVGHELQDRYRRLKWNFTAREVVLSGVFRTDVPRRDPSAHELARAEALLGELGLARLADRPFLELSRGEQRRVLLARSLAFEPRILLLDEPAAGLDQATRQTLNETIARIARHTTIIYTAHNPEDLPDTINRIARIEGGRIVEAGPFRRESAAQASSVEAVSSEPVRQPPRRPSHADGLPVIELEQADVWIDERRILHGLTWQLCAGEHWLVRGTNGSGKSTFLRLLHGQYRAATGGEIRWPALGNPRNIWELRRRVAWVSPELQAAYLYPSTVRACVASGFESSIGLMRPPNTEEAKWVDTLLERFELAALAGRNLTTLSYGQMRRVLIVRALVNKPRVLLLDEPWEGLDSPTLRLMQGYLAQIIEQGAQLVCASHEPRDLDCFTHELEIKDGRIVRAGPRTS